MKATILVIEDSRPINELICINLETAGYCAAPFYDGDEVSRHLRGEAQYDLAILDVMLPGRDGFELLPELAKKQIPVIFLTARGDLPSKVRGLREGAEDYIVKPFEMLELLVRVEKVLERCRKQGEADECLSVLDVDMIAVKQLEAEKLFARAEQIARHRLQEKELRLEIHIAENAGTIEGDEDLLLSFLTNLIDNAAKASAPGSTIWLTASEEGIFVCDEGEGILAEELEKVTEPFYMADKSRSRQEGGAGLGLALCEQIARLHGRKLRITSEPGKGTKAGMI